MKAESLVFAIAGIFFGVIVGWVIGSQQTLKGRPPAAPVAQASAAPPAAQAGAQQPAVLDQAKAQALRTVAEQNPKDPQPRVQLGNLYFDAEQYKDAITWYEAAYQLNPSDANVSTDLGVAYHYINQPDRALVQFEQSLAIDPKHTKTLFNMGIVKAFGKQDYAGAADAWQKVVALAPDTPEGQAAAKGLEGIRNRQNAKPGGSGGQ